MLRATSELLISKHHGKARRAIPNQWEYREINRWQREASGLTDFQHRQSHLHHKGQAHRFNPNWVGLSKGTPAEEAKKFLHYDQMKLPVLPPEGYEKPKPIGRAVWPAAWTEEFARSILDLSDRELKEFIMLRVTEVLHEESLRDGIELRRLDMEGNPMTELPDRSVIENYVLEEVTLRDRVVDAVVEGTFGFALDSRQLDNVKGVPELVQFVMEKVRTCRIPRRVVVTDAVLEFLEAQPIQPEFGYHHALPQDNRTPLVQAWEQSFHHRWQFGNAVYKPKTLESDRLNPHYIDARNRIKAQAIFHKNLESGKLREAHLAKIREAATM